MSSLRLKSGGGASRRQEVELSQTIEMIPVTKIDASDDNVRTNDTDVSELAASIAWVGLIQPITVVPNGGGYLAIAGGRRLKAARAAHVNEIPCIVRNDLEREEIIEISAMENLHREDLTPLEEARAYQQLVDLGRNQRDLGKRIGRSQSHISKRLALLKLPDTVRSQLERGAMTIHEATELAKLVDMPERLQQALEDAKASWTSIESAVKRQLQEHGRDQRRARAIEELKKSGTKVVDINQFHAHDGAETEPWTLVEDTGYSDSLGLSAGSHYTNPCHAAYLDYKDQPVYICTDPTRHLPDGDSSLKVNPDRAEEIVADLSSSGADNDADPGRRRRSEDDDWERERRALGSAQEKRRTFLAELVDKRISKSEVLDLLVRGWLHQTWDWTMEIETFEQVCRLVGIEIPDPKEDEDAYDNFCPPKAIEDFIDASPDRLAKVALAIGIDLFEWFLRPHGQWQEPAKDYFRFLNGHGYEASPAELAALEQKDREVESEQEVEEGGDEAEVEESVQTPVRDVVDESMTEEEQREGADATEKAIANLTEAFPGAEVETKHVGATPVS